MSQQENENVIERIKKLIRQANDEACSKEEADTAMKLANRLLLKYNLQLSEIDFREGKNKASNIIQEIYDLDDMQNRHEAEWVVKLFNVVATANMCDRIHLVSGKRYGQGRMAIIGLKHNVDITYYMVDQAIAKIRSLETMYWKRYMGDTKRNTFRRGFFIGAVEGLSMKLYQSMYEAEKEAKEEANKTGGNNQFALMVINNKEAIENFVNDNYHNLKTASKVTSYSGINARAAGQYEGQRMNLNKGLSNPNATAQIKN